MAEYKILNKRGDVVGYVVYAEDGAMAIHTKSMKVRMVSMAWLMIFRTIRS